MCSCLNYWMELFINTSYCFQQKNRNFINLFKQYIPCILDDGWQMWSWPIFALIYLPHRRRGVVVTASLTGLVSVAAWWWWCWVQEKKMMCPPTQNHPSMCWCACVCVIVYVRRRRMILLIEKLSHYTGEWLFFCGTFTVSSFATLTLEGGLPEDTWKIYNLHLPIPRPGSCLHWRWKLIPSTKIGPFRLSSCVLLCLFDLFSIYIY